MRRRKKLAGGADTAFDRGFGKTEESGSTSGSSTAVVESSSGEKSGAKGGKQSSTSSKSSSSTPEQLTVTERVVLFVVIAFSFLPWFYTPQFVEDFARDMDRALFDAEAGIGEGATTGTEGFPAAGDVGYIERKMSEDAVDAGMDILSPEDAGYPHIDPEEAEKWTMRVARGEEVVVRDADDE